MGSSLLTLVTQFCRRQSIPIPASVAGATDDQIIQIWGLLNEGQADLADRYNWPELIRTAGVANLSDTGTPYFASGGGGPQGWIAAFLDEGQTAVDSANMVPRPPFVPPGTTNDFVPGGSSTVVAPGFRSMIPETFWETTSRIPVYGPLTPAEWTYVTTFQVQPARFSYRVTNNLLWIYPYSATARFTFQYYTRFTVYPIPPTVRAQEARSTQFLADDDGSVLPDRIVYQDLRWRWRNVKGLPYAEDQRQVEQMILNHIARAPAPVLVLDQNPDAQLVGPGLYVAAGNTIPP